jgi:hypothetical protein
VWSTKTPGCTIAHSPPDPPGDVGGAEAGTQRLAAGDQAALVKDDPVHFEHDSSVRRCPGSGQRLPAHLWMTA